MRFVRIFLSLSLLLLFASSIRMAQAQDDPNFENGLKPFGSYHAGNIDHIDLSNGALNVDIPLISYPQRGGKLKLDFTLHYHNSGNYYDCGGYDTDNNCELYSGQETLDHGWNVQDGAPFASILCGLPLDDYNNASWDFSCQGAAYTSDGGVHQIFPESNMTTWRPFDSSGLQVSLNSPPNWQNTSRYSVTDASGVTYSGLTYSDSIAGCTAPLGNYYSGDVGGDWISRQDTNGNQITCSSSTGWTDTMGRIIPFEVSASPTASPACPTGPTPVSLAMTWNPPGVDGGTYPIKFCFGTVTETINYAEQTLTYTAYPMQTVILPNGTMWSFQYTSDGNADLSQITFPTGGTLSYTWTGQEGGNSCQPGTPCAGHLYTYTRSVATRTLNPNDGSSPAKWTYAGWGTWQSLVTDPAGNDTVHTFAAVCATPQYYETETQTYQGTGSNRTLLKTNSTAYSCSIISPYDSLNPESAIVPSQTTTLWPNGQENEVAYVYDTSALKIYDSVFQSVGGGDPTYAFDHPDAIGFSSYADFYNTAVTYGLLLSKVEYDYGSGAPGASLRTTTTNYLALNNSAYLNNNLLNLPASVQIKDGGGTQRAYTTYAYDESPSPSGALGNLTSTHRWLNTTGGYLVSTSVYDSNGRVTSSTDPCGNTSCADMVGSNHTTTYGYSGSYAGSGPTSVTNALGQTTTTAYDLNTGLPTETTDLNGQTTTYAYDEMLRATEITYPNNGQTLFSYPDPNDVTISEKIDTAGNYRTSHLQVDGLGRETRTDTTNGEPSGDDQGDTCYDGLGRVRFKTYAYQGAGIYSTTRTCPSLGTQSGEPGDWTTYDPLSRVIALTHWDASVATTSYTGGCSTTTDEAGRSRQSCSDGVGRLTQVIENPGGLNYTTSYTYDALNNLLSTLQSGSRQRSFIYDSLSRRTSVTNPESGTMTYTYDGDGNTVTETKPAPSQIGGTSGSSGTGTASVSGSEQSASGTPGKGTVTINGSEQSFQYCDPDGNCGGLTYDWGYVSLTVNGVTVYANYGQGGSYATDTTSSVAASLASAVNASTTIPVTATFSGSTVTLTAKTTGTASDYAISSSEYSGLVATYPCGSYSPCPYASFYATSGSHLTGGSSSGTTYDSGAVWITVNGFQASANYGQGSTASSLASAIASTLNTSSSPVTASLSGTSITLTARTVGSSTNYSVSCGSTTTFSHPSFSASCPSALTGGTNPGTIPTVTLSYCYDALNRMTSKAYTAESCPMPSPVAVYAYDQSSALGLTITNGIGHRTSIVDQGGSEAWSYDVMGHVATHQRTTNGITHTTSGLYNLGGDPTSITYPSGRTISYTYNLAERPTSAVDTANSITYASNVHYGAGGLCSAVLGSAITITSTFNPRLQPLEIQATTGAPPAPCTTPTQAGNLLDLTYNFNYGAGDNGNAASITNNIDGTRSQTFTYDALNRLATAQTGGTHATSPSHCWGESYTYDAWANLLSIGVSNTSYNGCTQEGFSQSMTASNQVSGFSYDDAGNQMGIPGGGSYAYDAENHLVSTAGVNYTYDGDGERVEKSNGEMYWYTSGGEVLDETDLSGNLTSEYVYFGGARIARRDGSGNIFYYLADHLGSSRVIVQAGQTTACFDTDYGPFGSEHDYTTSCPQNYKFTGKERDPESGLDNFEARYYGSSIARFTSPDDPFVGWNLADPQSLNLYAYVQDNPINDVDPTGHACYIVDGGSSMPCTFDDIASAMGADIPIVGNTQGLPGVIGPDTAGNAKTNSIQAAAQANDTETPQGQSVVQEIKQDIKDNFWGAVDAIAGKQIGLGTPGEKENAKGDASIGGLLGAGMATEGAVGEDVAASGLKLAKSLASEAQVAEKGVSIAGAGAQNGKALRAAEGLATQYGGQAGDWAKMSSTPYQAAGEARSSAFETHWYQNVVSDVRTEYKTVINWMKP